MKLSVVIIVSLLLGSGVGAALAYWSVGSSAPVTLVPPPATGPDGASKPAPVVVVDSPVHEFGGMLMGATSSHRFVVRNAGDAPLRLSVGKTSCKCTLGEVSDGAIPPGGSTMVGLSWTAKVLPGPFRQTATVNTNDPRRPTLELVVEGQVNEMNGLWPSTLDLGTVEVDAGGAASAYLMAFDSDDLQVTAEMSQAADVSGRYSVTVEPIDPLKAPRENALAAAKLTVEAGAGIPLGQVNRWVRVTTNLEGREDFLIPVMGRVRGAITVRGRSWNSAAGLINLGVVAGAEGSEAKVLLSCRGPHAGAVEYEVASVDPPELKAEIGERRMLREDVSHTELRVLVPAGTRPMVRMDRAEGVDSGDGDAVIYLKTNHPKSPEMQVRVRFLVQG